MITTETTREITNRLKLERGCEECGYAAHPAALEFDHIHPEEKYRTRDGKIVHLSDMIKGNRYALATVLDEISKCRVLCANCHAVHTHAVQRKG